MFELNNEQIERINPYLPNNKRGFPRIDEKKILSGIIHVLKSGIRWCDAPKEYGPYKTLYNRFMRWSKKDVFQKMFKKLVKMKKAPEQLQIDSTYIKVHRTATSLLKKGCKSCHWTYKRWYYF